MIFEQLNDGACKTYLIASETTHEAILVDPVVKQADRYLAEFRRRGLTPRFIVDTHVHADHVSAGALLKQRAGIGYVMHERSASVCADVRVKEGDVLGMGDVSIRFLHTPGHTRDSLTLVLPDRILTGDFLFLGEGGAGRTDLPGGDAGEHWDALQKLRDLPDQTLVYPAHDYHGHSHSTLGQERRTNSRLAPRTRPEYVAWLTRLSLEPAEWMVDVIRANDSCARDGRAVHIPAEQPTCEVGGSLAQQGAELVKPITPELVLAGLRARPPLVVLDVREPSEFDGPLGHIPGARLIPVGELPQRLGELEALRHAPLVTVCRKGGRSATAATVLATAGFDVRFLEGGMLGWNRLRYPTEPANQPR